jgi:hypothetical protein
VRAQARRPSAGRSGEAQAAGRAPAGAAREGALPAGLADALPGGDSAQRGRQVVRDTAGGLVRVASWDSNGSEGLGMGDALGGTAAAAAGPGDEAAAAPPVKIRRVGAKEIVYSRLQPPAPL